MRTAAYLYPVSVCCNNGEPLEYSRCNGGEDTCINATKLKKERGEAGDEDRNSDHLAPFGSRRTQHPDRENQESQYHEADQPLSKLWLTDDRWVRMVMEMSI
jgi:hypothetical protein